MARKPQARNQPKAQSQPKPRKATEPTKPQKRSIDLQWQMLIGFLVGLTAGLIVYATQADAPWVEAFTTYVTQPIGQIFLRLLFMLVIPLLFSALIVGISEMPTISAENSSGMTSMNSRRRKIWPIGWVT